MLVALVRACERTDMARLLVVLKKYSWCHTHVYSSANAKAEQKGTNHLAGIDITVLPELDSGICDTPSFLISTKAPNTIVNPVCCSNLSPFLSEMYTKRLAELGRVGAALHR